TSAKQHPSYYDLPAPDANRQPPSGAVQRQAARRVCLVQPGRFVALGIAFGGARRRDDLGRCRAWRCRSVTVAASQYLVASVCALSESERELNDGGESLFALRTDEADRNSPGA